MMYFLHGFQDILSFTKLTHRVFFDVKLPYPSPSVTVSLVGVWITLVFVVSFGYFFAVLIAVSVLRKFRATAEPTRTFRFLWHIIYSLFFSIQKRSRISPRAFDYFSLL